MTWASPYAKPTETNPVSARTLHTRTSLSKRPLQLAIARRYELRLPRQAASPPILEVQLQRHGLPVLDLHDGVAARGGGGVAGQDAVGAALDALEGELAGGVALGLVLPHAPCVGELHR